MVSASEFYSLKITLFFMLRHFSLMAEDSDQDHDDDQRRNSMKCDLKFVFLLWVWAAVLTGRRFLFDS